VDTTRAKEEREGMKDRVDMSRGIVTLIAEAFGKNQAHRVLKVSQVSSVQKEKLIRFFGQFSGRSASPARARIRSPITQNRFRPRITRPPRNDKRTQGFLQHRLEVQAGTAWYKVGTDKLIFTEITFLKALSKLWPSRVGMRGVHVVEHTYGGAQSESQDKS